MCSVSENCLLAYLAVIDPDKRRLPTGAENKKFSKILQKALQKMLKASGQTDPLLDIAQELEECALRDEYFIERKLYPNVDFYSGLILRNIGIPLNMFTVMFAIGRMPGWIAHWKEIS